MANEFNQKVTKAQIRLNKLLKQLKETGTISEKSFNSMKNDVMSFTKQLKQAGRAAGTDLAKGVQESGEQMTRFNNQMQGMGSELAFMASDATMMFQDTRMGLMAMGNNLQMVIMQLQGARDHSSSWGKVLKGLGKQLMGPTGIIIGMSLLIAVLPKLADMMGGASDETEALKDQLKGLKNQAKEIKTAMSFSSLYSKLENNRKVLKVNANTWDNYRKNIKNTVEDVAGASDELLSSFSLNIPEQLGVDELGKAKSQLKGLKDLVSPESVTRGGDFDNEKEKRLVAKIQKRINQLNKDNLKTIAKQNDEARENIQAAKERVDTLQKAGVLNEEQKKAIEKFNQTRAESEGIEAKIGLQKDKQARIQERINEVQNSNMESSLKAIRLLKLRTKKQEAINQIKQLTAEKTEKEAEKEQALLDSLINNNTKSLESLKLRLKEERAMEGATKESQNWTQSVKDRLNYNIQELQNVKNNLDSIENIKNTEANRKAIQQEINKYKQRLYELILSNRNQEEKANQTLQDRLETTKLNYKYKKLQNNEDIDKVAMNRKLLRIVTNRMKKARKDGEITKEQKQAYVEIVSALNKAKNEGDKLNAQAKLFKKIGRQASYTLVNGLRRAVTEGEKLKNIMDDILWTVLQVLVRQGISAAFTGGAGNAASGLAAMFSTQSAATSINSGAVQNNTTNTQYTPKIQVEVEGKTKGKELHYLQKNVEESFM